MRFIENQSKIVSEELPVAFNDKVVDPDKKALLKCSLCDKGFEGKKELKKHRKTMHPSKITCTECDLTFESSIALEMHLESHQKPKI